MASIRSQILDKVQTALEDGEAPVERWLRVPIPDGGTECWNIEWGEEQVQDEDGESVLRKLPLSLSYAKKGNQSNPDTFYDAVYLQAVAVAQTVMDLMKEVREFNETGTAPFKEEGEETIYGMTVSFEVQYSTVRGDPTTGA